jgi:oxygen-dependent protoporphyrinogen oxidase
MGAPQPGPVFGGIDGGYRVLVDALLERAHPRRATVAADSIRRDGNRWAVAPVGSFDLVVLAVRPPVAAALLDDQAPEAVKALSRIPMASPVVVALELPAETELPEISGVLVATGEALRAKAFTFSSRKWPHLRERPTPVIRASFGRFGEEHLLAKSDDDLVQWALEDLRTVTGVDTIAKSGVVQRWKSALPQYQPGHLDLVETIEGSIYSTPGMGIAGAFLNGVGVPACIGTATKAVHRLLG